MEYQIRSPRNRNELEQIFDLLGKCFTRTSREYYVNRTLSDSKFDLWQFQTLWLDRKLASIVKIYDNNIWIEGKKVKAAGLGSIATDVLYRNRGFATILICHAMQIIKNRGYKIAVLFTRIPSFYEKFYFFIVPRITCTFTRSPKIIIKNENIRMFQPDYDLQKIMQIHKIFSSVRTGCIIRNKKDWQAQRKYFNENEELFLILENQEEKRGYVRGRFLEENNFSDIKLLEYGAIDSMIFLLPYFVNFTFERYKPKSVSITLSQEDAGILAQQCEYVSFLPDNLMIFNIVNKKELSYKREKICFWEPDQF